MDSQSFYLSQKLPLLAPPAWIFGVVWPFLYILIFISYGMIVSKTLKGEVSFLFLLPFIINIISNVLFTYFQFGIKSNLLAFIDILIILITIVITIFLTWRSYPSIAYMQIPYLIWVFFATYLQTGILILNK